jgi:hypothetical protein
MLGLDFTEANRQSVLSAGPNEMGGWNGTKERNTATAAT